MPNYRVVMTKQGRKSSFYCYARGEMMFIPGDKGSEILGQDSALEIAAAACKLHPGAEILVVPTEEA